MGIQAKLPWALLLLLPWLLYIWWMARSTLRLSGKRKAAAIAVRALIILLLIALAAQLQPYVRHEQRNVVFVADRSASMKDEERLGEWIAEAWQSKAEEDRAAIVSVGGNAVVDRALTDEPLASERRYPFRTQVNAGYTDLAKGLQLASALLREQGGGRIVLLSDGAENAGDVRRQARLLKDSGIAVDIAGMGASPKRDAALDELTVPATLKQGETFSFEIAVSSTFAGAAELRLFADNKQLSAMNVQLEKGENRFALQSVALDPGFRRFRAEIYADEDEQQANNTAYAFSRVSGPPNVLIVEGASGTSGNIEAALTASVMRHQTIMPEQLPVELADYAAYDSIILNNVPATRMAEKSMDWLAKAVGDYGVGLVMLGGEDSFGLGGYFKTPIERALPVYMDLQGKKKIPSLGLMLVIDRSGSMSDGKLELAKEAALRTIELLSDEDTVGVVAFDSSPWWVVEPTKLSEREEVMTKIQGIQADGGTEIYSALETGYQGLLDIEAERKHMILLTDGQSATNQDYKTVTNAMNEQYMTLSTVGVGDGADQMLLKRLADDAKGRYYFTNDQSTLPAIFSRETVLMSRTYIVDQTFTPSIGEAGDWSGLWNDGIPAINAYIAATAKEMAEVALWTSDGDPLLARWPYGSGRTVAWTSDLTGKWSSEWVQWQGFPKALAEWIKWTFPQFDHAPYRITSEPDGSSAKLTIRAGSGGEAANSRLAAGIGDEAGGYELKRLMPVAPGIYEAKLSEAEPGVYLAQIGSLTEGAAEGPALRNGTTAGFVIPYSPEFRIDNRDGLKVLDQVASATGGRTLDAAQASESFRFEPIVSRQGYDWTRELLIAALLLWLIDIAFRRLSIPWARLAKPARGKLGKTEAAVPVADEAAASITRLKRRATEARRFYREDEEERKDAKYDIADDKPAPQLEPKPASANEERDAPAGEGTIGRLLAAKHKHRKK